MGLRTQNRQPAGAWEVRELAEWCGQENRIEKTLESSLSYNDIKPVHPKEISPEYSLEGLMLKLQHFGHLIRRAHSLEKTLMLGKTEDRRRRG